MIITVALQRVEGPLVSSTYCKSPDDLHSSGVVHSYIKKKTPVKVYFLVLES